MGHRIPDVYNVLEVYKLSKNLGATSNFWLHKDDSVQ